jgi:dipeptidyl aminopeptidase/acylaminoacyl peptidase
LITHSAFLFSGFFRYFFLLFGAAFLCGGERLVTWGSDALTQVWDVAASQPHYEPMRHTHRVLHAEAGTRAGREVFLSTLSHLKSRSADTKTGAAQLWKVRTGPNPGSRWLDDDNRGFDGGRLSPDGRLIALAKTTRQVWVLDAGNGEVVCGPLAVSGGAWGLMFSHDSSRLITATSRGQVALWSIPEGKRLGTPVELATTIQPAEMSPDGKLFATGSTDGFVRTWSAANAQVIHEMQHGAEVNSVAFSPDGRRVASAGEDRAVRIWDTQSGRLVNELSGHKNEVMAVFFSPDGRRLVTASLDFTARVWDAASARAIWTLPHQGEVIDAGFSPDGRWVATGSRDRTAVIWDAHTGLAHSHSLLHEQSVRNVLFSPDGKCLATHTFVGLRLWDVATGHPLTVHLPQPVQGGTGFQSGAFRPGFTSDGKAVLVAGDSYEARLWRFSVPPPGAPAWFPEFLEAVAGQRFSQHADRPETVPPERFLTIERKLQESAQTDYYTRWARHWLGGAQAP